MRHQDLVDLRQWVGEAVLALAAVQPDLPRAGDDEVPRELVVNDVVPLDPLLLHQRARRLGIELAADDPHLAQAVDQRDLRLRLGFSGLASIGVATAGDRRLVALGPAKGDDPVHVRGHLLADEQGVFHLGADVGGELGPGHGYAPRVGGPPAELHRLLPRDLERGQLGVGLGLGLGPGLGLGLTAGSTHEKTPYLLPFS